MHGMKIAFLIYSEIKEIVLAFLNIRLLLFFDGKASPCAWILFSTVASSVAFYIIEK